MDKISIGFNDGKTSAILVVNESIVLLHGICTLTISQDPYENIGFGPTIKHIQLENWIFKISFLDSPASGVNPMGAFLYVNYEKRIATITCHKWYGDGLENTEPFVVSMDEYRKQFLVKLVTTCFESKPERRTVQISIWKKST